MSPALRRRCRRATGIGLTLLPELHERAGFRGAGCGSTSAASLFRRGVLVLERATTRHVGPSGAALPHAGVAIHSLLCRGRAVDALPFRTARRATTA
ncbi:MAG: hypothetical protein IPM15_01655 [Betaproteobacteria bacterium]|nr:hypothetical protein [Betaproteobacteria bacterium]